jgi:hypothetical protein
MERNREEWWKERLNNRLHIGAHAHRDVHKRYAEVTTVDEGNVITKHERIENESEQVEELPNRLSNATMVSKLSSS